MRATDREGRLLARGRPFVHTSARGPGLSLDNVGDLLEAAEGPLLFDPAA